MAIPDFQTLMLPVLKLAQSGEISTTQVVGQLSDSFGLTEAERSELLPSGRQATIANRVHWALAYLNKAGLLTRVRRGVYTATPVGKEVAANSPVRIDIKFLTQYPAFREFRETQKPSMKLGAPSDVPDAAETPEERIDGAFAELDASLQLELLDRARSVSPRAFERLIVDLMLAMGYGSSGSGTHLGRANDGGIDGVINEDALGLDVIFLQAKRYGEGNAIGVEKVREFAGTLDERGATKGVFVTTSHFAAGARQYSSRSPKRIVLIDGKELAQLLVRYGVAVRPFRKLEIKRMDTDYFDDLDI